VGAAQHNVGTTTAVQCGGYQASHLAGQGERQYKEFHDFDQFLFWGAIPGRTPQPSASTPFPIMSYKIMTPLNFFLQNAGRIHS